MTQESGPVWLYDGVCVLCSGAVDYVLRHERHQKMRFIAIQSGEGRALAVQNGINPDNPESFLFIDQGQALQKSDGVLALLRHVRGPVQILRMAMILPRPVRDWLYDRIACNRYALFGKRHTCMLPDASLRHRFTLPG